MQGLREPYNGDCTEWSGSFNSSRPASLDGLRIEVSADSRRLYRRERRKLIQSGTSFGSLALPTSVWLSITDLRRKTS